MLEIAKNARDVRVINGLARGGRAGGGRRVHAGGGLVAGPSRTEQRKAEHVDIILNENVSAGYNYWNDVHLVHRALPEIDLDDVDVSCTLFGRKLNAPLVISSMTGGFSMGREINANLAKAAAEVGVRMGVGPQRAALEKPELVDTYAVVKDHDVPLRFANLGAPQLVPQEGKRAYGLEDARRAMAMVDAHMLIVHLNFLQEVVQPEGARRARGGPRPRERRAADRRDGRDPLGPRRREGPRPRGERGGDGEADARGREDEGGRGRDGARGRDRGAEGGGGPDR